VLSDPNRVRALITHRFPFEEKEIAMRFALENPHDAEKVLITM
jgi:hypothetical protein